MAARTFAQINTGILRSKKLKECNHSEKWAYMCAHFTHLGSFHGFFEYPLVLWAQDADMSIDELREAVNRLCDLGLVEYDFEEEYVRIVGVHRQRPPDNASKVMALTSDYYSLAEESSAQEMMRLRGVAEFSVAAVQRAQQWKPDSPEHEKLRDALKPFLNGQWQEHGGILTELIDTELERAKKTTRDEMEALFPQLHVASMGTVPTPCPHHANTVAAYTDTDETQTQTNTKTKTQTQTAHFDEIAKPEAQRLEEVLQRQGTVQRSLATVGAKNSMLAKQARGSSQ